MLVHSPTHLFIIPGSLMTLAGRLIALTVLAGVDVFGRAWSTSTR